MYDSDLENSFNREEKKEKSKIKVMLFKIFKKLKIFIKNKIEIVKVLSLIVICITFLIFVVIISYDIHNKYSNSPEKIKEIKKIENNNIIKEKVGKKGYYSNILSIDERISKLKQSYEYYKNRATDKEKIMRWIDLYFTAVRTNLSLSQASTRWSP